MVTIGDDTLPGNILTVESAPATGTSLSAPATPVILGQADLAAGSASADTAYRVTRPKRAQELFGRAEDSQLTIAVQSALTEGAYPVYAIAPATTAVTAEDLSGVSSTSTTLSNAPVLEDPDDVTFTINSTTKTTVFYYEGDPENATPGTDEVLVNPQTGKVNADESMGNTGDEVDYTYVDYANTFDEVTNATVNGGDDHLREVVDFMGIVDEKDTVVTSAKDKAESMEGNGWFVISVGGAGEPYIDDQQTSTDETSSYSDNYDTSRLQLIHPTRDADGDTLLGSYLGLRCRLGINRSPLFKQLGSVQNLIINLDEDQKKNLVNANVNPIDEASGGAKVVEDLTTVADDNLDEIAWQRGFARLVTDFTSDEIDVATQPFIGEFNRHYVQNTIEARVQSILNALLQSNAIEGFTLVVEEVDSLTLALDIGINTSDVLRNIEITISAGELTNATSAEA
jgi:hypothetical protein